LAKARHPDAGSIVRPPFHFGCTAKALGEAPHL
jgi:hypothetical protein